MNRESGVICANLEEKNILQPNYRSEKCFFLKKQIAGTLKCRQFTSDMVGQYLIARYSYLAVKEATVLLEVTLTLVAEPR